jgi:hypothetical protein
MFVRLLGFAPLYPESNRNIPTSHGLHDSFEAAAILAKTL